MLFKIRAWLDLTERLEAGEQIDSKTVKKHKNDIFRLLINVDPSRKIAVEDRINEDILRFLEKIKIDQPDLKHLGIRTVTIEELLDRIRELFTYG